MKLPRVCGLLIASLGIAFCSLACASPILLLVQDQDGKPLPGAVVEISQTQPEPAPEHSLAIMDQRDKRFFPELLVVQQGQRVSFPNSDNIRHHVYSFSAAKSFELKLYSGHPEQPVIFDQVGVVVLGCNIHDAMVGYIYVAASPFATVTDEQGYAVIDPIDAANAEILVWHPLQSAGTETRQRVALADPALARLANGAFVLTHAISSPAPRDTFRAKFRAAEK